MYVTKLIDFPAYKDFLRSNFLSYKSEKNKTLKSFFNSNPSLTGYSFELFFLLKHTSKSRLKIGFMKMIVAAEKALEKFIENKSLVRTYSNTRYLNLSTEEFQEVNFRLLQVMSKGSNSGILMRRRSKPIKIVELSRLALDFEAINAIHTVTGYDLFSIHCEKVVIYCQTSAHHYYKALINDFEKEARAYLATKRVTTGLVKSLLCLSNMSSDFYPISKPLLEPDTRYVEFCKSLFNSVNVQYKMPSNQIFVYKPSMTFNGIRARPDFLVGSELVELKTGTSILKTDYWQALTYLMFAQTDENRVRYGEVKSIALYYGILGRTVQITLEEVCLSKKHFKLLKRVTDKFMQSSVI